MRFKFIFLSFGLMTLASCGSSNKPSTNAQNTQELPSQSLTGQQLWERNCNSCHGPGTLSAPTLAQIQIAYANDSEAKYSESMLRFLKSPARANSKMPEAIDKFNLMPKLAIPEKDLQAIVKHLYAQQQSPHTEALPPTKNPDGSINYLAQGREFAMQTKAILSKNLLGAIEKKGTSEAVSFCNTQAIPLTDSMAMALKAKIKRVSDLPRNSKNVANSSELKIIERMKLAISENKEPQPEFVESSAKFVGYYPITTNKMCLQCHGKAASDIQQEVSLKLNTLYPKDKAIGYIENQLRGIWVVDIAK